MSYPLKRCLASCQASFVYVPQPSLGLRARVGFYLLQLFFGDDLQRRQLTAKFMLMVATEIQRVVSGRTFAGLYPLQSRSFELGNLLFTEQLLVLCGRLLFGLLWLSSLLRLISLLWQLRRWLRQLGLWLCCCFCRRLLTILARG